MRVASFCLLALGISAGALHAADSVSVHAVGPGANEEGLVPGQITFRRTGSSQPLVVRYRITGDARSDKHGAYASAVTLPNTNLAKGAGYQRDTLGPVLIVGSGALSYGSFQATSLGGALGLESPVGSGFAISGITVTQKGSLYDQAPPPIISITDVGTLRSIEVSDGGSGYTAAPIVTVDVPRDRLGAAIGVAATATAVIFAGRVTNIVVDTAGSGYLASVAPPSITITPVGPAPARAAAAQAVMDTIGGQGASPSAIMEQYVVGQDSSGNDIYSYRVGRVDVGITNAETYSSGHGYINPSLTIDGPASGGGIQAQAFVAQKTTHPLNGATFVSPGYGYDMPTASASNPATTPAVLTAVLSGEVVVAVTVTSPGTGYGSNPVVTVSGGGGTGAVAQATVSNGQITAVTLLHGGGGYSSAPTVTATNEAVLRPVVDGGAISTIAVESGGYNYPMPAVTITDSAGTGSGATGKVTVTGGRIVGIALTNGGSGYTGVPMVTLSGSGSGATFSGTVSGGQVVDLRLLTSGSGYTCPTVVLAGTSTTAATTEATVADGQITAVTVLSGGAGYGAIPSGSVPVNDPTTATETQGNVQIQFAQPDFLAPFGTAVETETGDLVGTITIPVGQTEFSLPIVPRRNGVGGGRELRVVVEPPLTPGAYIVDQQSTARVSIADGDERASITVDRTVAYPIPPAMDNSLLPVEVQGRATWHVAVSGAERLRQIAINVEGDDKIGPVAVQGTDYLLVENTKDVPATASDYVNASNTKYVPVVAADGPAKVGATVIPIEREWPYDIPTVVSFDNVADPLTIGVYTVTNRTPGTATLYPSITITPALRKVDCIAGVTRVRRLGDLVSQPIRYTFGYAQDLYYFAIPAYPFDAVTPRGRRSIALNFLQTDDYRVLSPTVGSVTLADNAVQTGLRFGANAGQPSTNGYVEVVFSAAFPVDITVPFYVLQSSTSVLGTEFTISGVDVATRRGSVRVPAGQTVARIEIAPKDGTQVGTKTVELALETSRDYTLVPRGTSPVNPTASLAITEAPKTNLGEAVFLAVRKIVDGREPSTNGSFRVVLTDTQGVDLIGFMSQNLAVSYAVSGNAVPGTNYVPLSGMATIPAGSRWVDVPIQVNDDGAITDDRSVVIRLASGAGYQVSNQSTDTVTIVDNGARVSVTASAATATRGGANGVFTVTNSRVVNRDVVVNYTISGSAIAGTDYPSLPGAVTIPAASPSATIQIAALSPVGASGTSTVVLTLADDSITPATYMQVDPKVATVTIQPAAPPPSPVSSLGETVYIALARLADATEPATNGRFRLFLANAAGVALSGVATAPITVAYNQGGTAVGGINFTALSGTATIPAGASSVDVDIVPIDDGVVGNTSVTITLPTTSWPATGATATITIVDGSPTLTIASTVSPAIQGSTNGVFTISSSRAPVRNLSVTYTVAGTAVAGTDYTTLTGTATLPAGQTSLAVTVAPTLLRLSATAPTVTVTLAADTASPATYLLGASTTASITIRAPFTTMAETVYIGVRPLQDAVEAGQNGAFRFFLANKAGEPLTGILRQAVNVTYSVGGAAEPDVNFTRLSGSALILQGTSSVDVSIPVLSDGYPTMSTVQVSVDDTAWYLVSDVASATINLDDPGLPLVSISSTTSTAVQGGTNGVFTVSAASAVGTALIVPVVFTGTAVAGTDYETLATSAVIPAGQSSVTITVKAKTGTLSTTTPVLTAWLDRSLTATHAFSRRSPDFASVSIQASSSSGGSGGAGSAAGTTDQSRILPFAGGGGGSSGGCGLGSGLGLVLLGGGLAVATALRRRRH